MNHPSKHLVGVMLAAIAGLAACSDPHEPAAPSIQPVLHGAKGGGGKPSGETAGNNLSYPVIWAEGVTKILPGTAGVEPVLQGEWWYQWGTNGVDPDVTPASCKPDPDASNNELNPDNLPLCDDGIALTVDLALVAGTPPADNPLPLAMAYLQKDVNNVWQAGSFTATAPVNVDLVDWGDNLESVDWYTTSQVRTEVVLFEDSGLGDLETYPWPMLEYEMRHTDGWGINEVHGLATSLDVVPVQGVGERATVYSNCARLTIQRLLTDRGDPELANLKWVPGEGWTELEGYEGELVNPYIFNGSVHEGGDGPGFYSAEINVKGRIIYGYTWNVKQLNEGAGDYRITFSFDDVCGTGVLLNTYFVQGVTDILVPVEEEEVVVAAADDEGGATAVLLPELNLTYIDVRILPRGGGGGGGGGKGHTK